MLIFHGLVKIFEILTTPIAAIGGPPRASRLNPGIRSREVIRLIVGRLILIDQQRWRLPTIAMLANEVPIHVSALGKDEEQRTAVVGEIGLPVRRRGAEVRPVGFVERSNCVVGGLRAFVFCL